MSNLIWQKQVWKRCGQISWNLLNIQSIAGEGGFQFCLVHGGAGEVSAIRTCKRLAEWLREVSHPTGTSNVPHQSTDVYNSCADRWWRIHRLKSWGCKNFIFIFLKKQRFSFETKGRLLMWKIYQDYEKPDFESYSSEETGMWMTTFPVHSLFLSCGHLMDWGKPLCVCMQYGQCHTVRLLGNQG